LALRNNSGSFATLAAMRRASLPGEEIEGAQERLMF
jgi:hypothetical protein